MAGQSEAADDLIAELAKLMAQDAQGDRTSKPAAPATPSAQFAPVRIPGDHLDSQAPRSPADFLRANAPGSDTPVNQEPTFEPAVASDAGGPTDVKPFEFDFAVDAAHQPAPASEDVPAPAPAQSAEAPAPAEDAPAPGHDHDSIADLISADLADSSTQASGMEPTVPDLRAEPAPVLMSPVVANTPEPQYGLGASGARADQDRFKVPPVFGLGSATATATTTPASAQPTSPSVDVVASAPIAETRIEPQPALRPADATTVVPQEAAAPVDAAALDPIDEIENLIGRAMRVEFDLPEDERPTPTPAVATPRPAPSPALRSLATPVLPAQEPSGLSAADQTIFAAAEATGAKIGWVNEPVSSVQEPEPFQAAPRQRRSMGMSRALAGPLVAITLLLAAGFGLYWVLGYGSRDTGPAPLLTADTSPIKEAAPVATEEDNASAQSVVFSEMDGVASGADEQLVSRDQTDVNEVTQVAAAAPDLSDEGLANRKVRTVKVRPDGTIVSGEDSVAGSAILPVDRPNVPAVPGAETATPELLANVEPAEPVETTPAETGPAADLPAATAPTETTPDTTPAATAVPVAPGATVPAVDLGGNPIAGRSTTIPLQRPNGLRLSSAAQASLEPQPVTTDPQLAPVAAAAPSVSIPGATEVAALGNTAPAYVQLASQRSEADARQSAQNMVTRFGPLFGGANLEVQRVDLGAKGIYYRVRVPAQSLEQANLICANVKAAGGDCFTL